MIAQLVRSDKKFSGEQEIFEPLGQECQVSKVDNVDKAASQMFAVYWSYNH